MTQRAHFTVGSAARIAKVVRAVENARPGAPPLRSRRVTESKHRDAFRVGTFTGAWPIDSAKTVTFQGQTNTVSVTNLFLPLPSNGTRNCAIAKDGTAWYLLQARWEQANVLSGASLTSDALEFTRVSGVSLGTASTVQISVTTCSTAAQ